MAPRSTRYLDHIVDWQDRTWYVNDRVIIVIPTVRRDAGRIVECTSAGIVRVELETGGFTHARTADLELVRRRTAEEEPIRMISHAAPLRVIEWPQKGSAQRYPMGGWWVVELGEGGYSPVVGPFRTQAEAEADKAKRLTPDGQS